MEWNGINQTILHRVRVSVVLLNYGFSYVCVPNCDVKCIFYCGF